MLGEFNFIRTHKSHLVNPKYIKQVTHNKHFLLLSDGSRIEISRRNKELVQQYLKLKWLTILLAAQKPFQCFCRVGRKTGMDFGCLQNRAAGSCKPPEARCSGQCSNRASALPVTFANLPECMKISFNLDQIYATSESCQAIWLDFGNTSKKSSRRTIQYDTHVQEFFPLNPRDDAQHRIFV